MDKATRLSKLAEIMMGCRSCTLHTSRPNAVFGEGNPDAPVMLVGEAPGKDERACGRPFVGKSGKLLRAMLTAIGLNPEKDCYIANVVKDWPPGNRKPELGEMLACIKLLFKQIEIIQPKLLILLGRTAVEGVMPTCAKMGLDALRDKSKNLGMLDYAGIPVLVTYHPSALLRDPAKKPKMAEDFRYLQSVITSLYPGKGNGHTSGHVPSEQLPIAQGVGIPG